MSVTAEDTIAVQFILFFIATAAFAFLLWKSLQRSYVNHRHDGENNIGGIAYVGSGGLQRGKIGEVTWSGTIAYAELAADSPVQKLDAGAAVIIAKTVGARLVVTPKA